MAHTAPMPRADLPLAAYLTARTMVGRPVGTEDVERLKKANLTLNETRQQLPRGRGNVTSDLKATDNRSQWRTAAVRTLTDEMDVAMNVAPYDLHSQSLHHAAAATAFGAGNCGEYTSVAMTKHAARLQPHEEMHNVGSSQIDHAWAEARLGPRRERAVVIDAWSNGPPVLAPDARFAKAPASQLYADGIFAPDPAGVAEARVQTLVDEVHQHVGEEGMKWRMSQEATPAARLVSWIASRLPTGGVWTPQNVVDPAFANEARSAIDQHPVEAQIAAAGVARALGRSVETQKTDVPQILDAMRTLEP